MALIKCEKCHKTISDKALECPHCGWKPSDKPSFENKLRLNANLKKDQKQKKATFIAVLIICPIIAFMTYIFIFGNESNFEDGSPLNILGYIYKYGLIVPSVITILLYSIGFIILKVSHSK